ncbi:hypothetical protein [Niallia sp. NCCP-28]|uniref:hypothetical protein n=1 Tax=Niallia sp. NCCP-28 TaxID=2934712 RepID=UPI0020894EBB|nr:hypothetical protein [Niallia sp. NCCP-28]GKU82304.1 hypothetical protein NCCP28_17000 [Niallia sp. NCCP-28]
MEEKDVYNLLEQLKNGEVEKITIKKEEFLQFRKYLVERNDFKYFRGIALRGGDVAYTYLSTPRS